MGDETSRLVVQVTNQGINETTSSLAGLANQARTTESATASLNAASKTHSTTTKQATQTNQQAGESFGSLALKIAGYSSALNLGISIARSAVTGMKDLAVEAVTLAGSFERSRVAWGVFMKDVSAGSQMFDELYGLAQRTPLTFQGVESAAQMLKGFGLAASDIIPTLERMGDVARGNDETMQRLALAYGQALAQGKVLTRDLYQFVNAGVPIFDALSQVMGKSVEQVQALVTDGKVGFPEIEKALKALTEEGGQFNGMMEKTALTFEGKLSIATDNWKVILANLGDTVIPTLKNALDLFNESAEKALSRTNLLKVLQSGGGSTTQAVLDLQNEREKLLSLKAAGQTYAPRTWWESIGDNLSSSFGGSSFQGLTIDQQLAIISEQLGMVREVDVGKNEGARHSISPSLYAPPTITTEETKWRNLLQEQGIQSWQKDWTKSKNGTYTPDENLTSGYELVTRKLDFDKLGFENVVGSPYEEGFRKDFTKKAEALQEAMLTSGLWKIGERSISVIDEYIAKYGYTKPEKYVKPTEYTDPWSNKIGGGVSYMTKGNADSVLESIASSMALSASAELSASAGRVSIDRWTNRSGGGVPLLSQEEADSFLSGIDASIANELLIQLSASAARSPADRWQSRAGGGVRFLTAEQAGSILSDIDGRIVASIAQELSQSASRYKSDRWETKVGGGVSLLTQDQANSVLEGINGRIATTMAQELAASAARYTYDKWETRSGGGVAFLSQEAADSLINGIDNKIASDLQLELAKASSRAPSDRWAAKVGGGVAYLTPEEAQAALDTIGASIDLSVRIELEAAAERVPADRWNNKAGGGIPYLSQEAADAITGALDAQIASGIRAELLASSSRSPADRWLNKAGGGTSYLTPEQAQEALDVISSSMFLDNNIEISASSARAPADKWLNKPGGGIPYIHPKQVLSQLAINAIQTPSGLLDENRKAFEGASPSTDWRNKPISTNPLTGDIKGYTVQQATTEAEKYQEAQDALDEAFQRGEISISGYNQRQKELAEQYNTSIKLAKDFGDAILTTTVNTLADEMYNLGNALVTGADGWTSFGDAMGNTLETIIKMLPKLAIQVGLSMLGDINPANDAIGWGLIGGGLVGSVGTGLLGNANGGVYSSPSLHQYANGVYDKPQTFAFARGGVFGEAGPEAIMPLSRDSSGRLGVKSQSSNGDIAVQIINQTGMQVEGKAKTITDAAGNKKLQLTLKQMVRQEIAEANAGGVRKS